MVHRLCRVLRQLGALCAVTMIVTATWPLAAESRAQQPKTPPMQSNPPADPLASPEMSTEELINEMRAVVVRLPLAAALGTALALRPRRRGTPTRQPAVVQ